jgi:hypothetical protein
VAVAAEAAVERNEARRARPLLGELQVPVPESGVEEAGSGPAEVEKDAEEHQDSLVLEVQEVGLSAQIYRVDRPRASCQGGGLGPGASCKRGQAGLAQYKFSVSSNFVRTAYPY